jgi:hypothetical protein
MTAQTATYTVEQLAETIANMSNNFAARKVTVTDVNSTEAREVVAAVAHDIVTNYTGSYGYMLNMRQYVALGLTDAQIAGVLNCAIADHRYAQRKAAVKQAETIVQTTARTYDHSRQYVADGYYTVVGPKGGHRTLRLQTIDDNGTKQWLAYLSGADNVGDYKSVGFVNGNEVSLFNKYAGQYADIMAAARFLVKNVDKLDECGRQYAINSGKCYRCNRLLTTPESVARGLGPVCAAK